MRPPPTFKEDVVICAVEIEFVDMFLIRADPDEIVFVLIEETMRDPDERVKDLIVSAVKVDV